MATVKREVSLPLTCEERATCRWVLDKTGWQPLAKFIDWFVRTPLKIVLVVMVAGIAAKVTRRLIARATRGYGRVNSADERGRLRSRTLNTVLASVAVGIIWSMAVVSVISALGVNLGAFVVTASVIGGAIGFGAQQLVRDVLTGLFVLGEDQYGVGDLIDVGFVEGTVEIVTLRSVRLRDSFGKVWHVPHGNVQRVANLSQGWANSVIDVSVGREMGPDAAMAAVKELVAGLGTESEVADMVLEPPRVLGLQEVQDDRMVFRIVVKTQPARQYVVSRAIRLRLLQAQFEGLLPVPVPIAPAALPQTQTPEPPSAASLS